MTWLSFFCYQTTTPGMQTKTTLIHFKNIFLKNKIPLKRKNVSYGKGLIQPINFVCPLNLRG